MQTPNMKMIDIDKRWQNKAKYGDRIGDVWLNQIESSYVIIVFSVDTFGSKNTLYNIL